MDNGPFGTWYIIHIAITFSQTSLPLTSHLFVVGTTSMASYCFSWVINYIHYQVSIIKVLYKLKIVGALGCKGGASLTGSFLIGRMLLASNYSTRKKEPRYFMLPGAFPPSPLLSSSFIFSSHPLSFFHSDSKKKKKTPPSLSYSFPHSHANRHRLHWPHRFHSANAPIHTTSKPQVTGEFSAPTASAFLIEKKQKDRSSLVISSRAILSGLPTTLVKSQAVSSFHEIWEIKR